MRKVLMGAIMMTVLGVAGSAAAVPITITIGDNDGYGPGCPDNGTCVWNGPGGSGENMDRRSAAEAASVNGAQLTDVYSAIFPGFGPNPSTTGDVLFALGTNKITAGSITIDMGDFQASTFGPIAASINGVPISFAFDDGFRATAIRSFTLTAAMIATANLSGIVDLHMDRNASTDFIAFDYFQLNAEAVPEPASLLLLGTGLLGGLRAFRKRSARRASR